MESDARKIIIIIIIIIIITIIIQGLFLTRRNIASRYIMSRRTEKNDSQNVGPLNLRRP